MMDTEDDVEGSSGGDRCHALRDGAQAQTSRAYSLALEAGMQTPTVVLLDLSSTLAHQLRDAMHEEGSVGQESAVVHFDGEPVPVEALAVPTGVAKEISPARFDRHGPVPADHFRVLIVAGGSILITFELISDVGPTRPFRSRHFS
jgi:hypothetical protein